MNFRRESLGIRQIDGITVLPRDTTKAMLVSGTFEGHNHQRRWFR